MRENEANSARLRVQVEVRIDGQEEGFVIPMNIRDKVEASVVQALRNELLNGQRQGFSHDMENVISLEILSVDVVDSKYERVPSEV